MKRIPLFVVFIVLFSINTRSYGADYSSSLNKFSISYPADWKPRGYIMFSAPKEDSSGTYRESINVIVEDVKPSVIMEQYASSIEVKGPKKWNDFHIVEKGPALVGGLRAKFYIFEAKEKDYALKSKQYTLVKGTKAYTVTYTALVKDYDAYLSEAEKAIQSIVLQ